MKAVYLWLAVLLVGLALTMRATGQAQAAGLTALMIVACGGMIVYVCRAR